MKYVIFISECKRIHVTVHTIFFFNYAKVIYEIISQRNKEEEGNVLWIRGEKKEMEHLVTTGKIDVKRSRGRQREKMLDSMTSWLQKENPI